MRNVPVAANLIRGVDDHHPFAQVIGQHAGGLAQQSRLSNAWAAHHQDAAPRLDNVANDGDGAEYGAADAAGDADNAPLTVANGGDAMQRALDASAIVVAEGAD